MKKEDILNQPLGKFSGLKYSKGPYLFLRLLCGKNNGDNFWIPNGDTVLVKDILNFSPKLIVEQLSLNDNMWRDRKRNTLKGLALVRQKLLDAGFSEKKYPFLRSPYFVTSNSNEQEWEKLWVGNYEITKLEARKLTELLRKVNYTVRQSCDVLLF